MYGCVTLNGQQFVIGEEGISETNSFEVLNKVNFTIAGHESQITKQNLKVGCTEIDKGEFINVIKLALLVGFINFDDIKQ